MEVAVVQVDLVLVQPKVSKAMRCVHKMHTSFFYKEIKSQFYNYVISSIIRIKLISTPGGRFPRARLQSPRHCVPAGLSARAVPAGVATLRSNQQNPLLINGKYHLNIRVLNGNK